MKLKWIWFDLGYTLVYKKRETAFQKAIMKYGINKDIKDIHYGFHITDKLFMREYKGYLSKDKQQFMPLYLKKLIKNLSIKEDELNINEGLEEFYRLEDEQAEKDGRMWHAYEDSKNVLEMLKNQSIKLGIISNWDITAREVLRANGLYEYFDEIIISSEVNISKPTKKIFDMAITKANVLPKECLYVGDNYYDDTIGSTAVGMNSVIINPYKFHGIEELNEVDVITNIVNLPEYIKIKNIS